MSQPVADEAAALGGDPVDTTTDASETVVDQPEEVTEGEMYPDDLPPEGEEGEQPSEEGESEPAQPAIEAPNSWKAEEKAMWGNLPREAQEIIARRETEFARGMTDKAKEVEQARTSTVQQAATEIAQFRQQQAQVLQRLAAQVMPEAPDQRLLMSDDPAHHVLYNRQRAIFESAVAQQQQLQQAAQHEMSEAQRIEQDLQTKAKEADDAKLREEFPEYFDEGEKGQKIRSGLKALADEAGYSALWDQRNAADVLALRKWQLDREDAQRWRSYDRNRRNPKGQYQAQRTLPPVSKPGTSQGGRPQAVDTVKLLYPND